MGLFGKKMPPTQPPRPASRTIPTLEPDYFESIQQRLVAAGGSLTSTQIAAGVANAVYNTGSSYLARISATKAARDFEALYGARSQGDRTTADRMIDFLVTQNPSIQAGEGGFLGSLLMRLSDVLSKPE